MSIGPTSRPGGETSRRRAHLAVFALVVTIAAGPFAGAGAGSASAGSCASLDPFTDDWAASYLAGVDADADAGTTHLAAAVEDVSTGCRFHLGSDDVFPPASTAKVAILGAALLRAQDRGDVGLPASVAGWATPMISQSDNDAADALYDDLGGPSALGAYERRLGLTLTDSAGYSWGGAPTTPDDQLALLHTLLAGGGALAPVGVAAARSLLSSVVPEQRWGVSAGVPAGSSVFVKNGWLFNDGTMWGPSGYWRVNSIGLVQLPNGRRYTIAVYGDTWATMADGIAAIETLSRHVATVLAAPRTGGGVDAGPGTDPGVAATADTVDVAPSAPSVFTATSPLRLLDTRTTGRALPAGGEVTVDVSQVAGPPGDSRLPTAVALNVTAVDAAGPGYVTVYPGGTDRPLASNLNTRAGAVTPNLVVVPVGSDGTVRLYTSTPAALVVDLLGSWRTVAGADSSERGTAVGVPAAGGRITVTTPARVLDTRQSGGALAAGGQVSIPVAGRGGVPASGAAAVVVNVTATDVARAGYWTVWPGASARPTASNLNTAAGDTAANTTLVPIGSDGAISVFSQSGGNVVVDVLGWVTADAPATARATAGELVVFPTPTRVADSRFGDGGVDRLTPDGAAGIDLHDAGVPPGASAVLGNLTYAAPSGDGFLTAYPAGAPRPGTSSANPSAAVGFGANALVVGTSDARFELSTSVSTDVVVDAWGWLTS